MSGKTIMDNDTVPKWIKDQYATMHRDRDRWLAIAEAQAARIQGLDLEILRLERERTRSTGIPLQGIVR